MADTDEYFAQLALASRGPVSLSVQRDQRRTDAIDDDELQSKASTWSFPKSFSQGEKRYCVFTIPRVINDPNDYEKGADNEGIKSDTCITEQKRPRISNEALRHISQLDIDVDGQHQEASNTLVVLNLKENGKSRNAQGSQRLTILRSGGKNGNYLFAGYVQLFDQKGENLEEDIIVSLRETVLHIFPTRICSISLGNPENTLEHSDDHGRICVRTISSTVFANVNIEKDLKEEILDIRLTGVLEIMHGKSALSSGVPGYKKKEKAGFDQVVMVRSVSSISDVIFHPNLSDQALTVDARGTLARFQAELVSVSSKRWTTINRWEEVSKADPTIVLPESESYIQQWSVAWLADADIAFLTCQKGIFAVHISTKERKCIFIAPTANRIWCCKLLQEPRPLLWIITTTDICILEADPDLEFRQLISFAHERNSQNGLYLTALDSQLTSQMVALWDRNSQLLLTQTVHFEGLHGPISLQSRQDDLYTMTIGSKEHRACSPLFIDASDHPVLRYIHGQNRRISSHDLGSIRFIFELSSSGDVWMSAIGQEEVQGSSRGPKYTKYSIQPTKPLDLDISATRSLHSFGEVYRALMRTFAGAGALHDTLGEISNALQDWPEMMKADQTRVSTAVLPIELLVSILQGSKTVNDDRTTSKPLSLQTCVISQHLLFKQLQTSLDSFLALMNVGEEESIKRCSFPLADILSETGSVLKIEDIVRRLAEPFHDSYVQKAKSLKNTAANAHWLNIQTASQEVATDLALTSVSLMKTSAVDDSTLYEEEGSGSATRRKGNRIPADVPKFVPSFFKPTSGESGGSSSANKDSFQSRMGKVSLAAHLLLDEWTVGNDPTEYEFSHPYDDDEEYTNYENHFSGRTTPDSNRSSSLRPSQSGSRPSSQVPPEPFYPGSSLSQFPRASQTIESAPALLSNWGTHSRNNSNSSPFHFPTSTSDGPPATESAPQMMDISSSQKQSQKSRKKRRVGGF